MSPKTQADLLKKFHSGNYFSFTVVRHPLDRILSAFRDRILNGCTGQSKTHVPRIFRTVNDSPVDLNNLTDAKGCIQTFPSFTQFLKYLIIKPDWHDAHWRSYTKTCSPCILDYDAIIKLETADRDQDFVLKQSGLSAYTHLDYKHPTKGGKSQDFRKEFYSQVSCDLLQQILNLYRADFDLFGYESALFNQYCRM